MSRPTVNQLLRQVVNAGRGNEVLGYLAGSTSRRVRDELVEACQAILRQEPASWDAHVYLVEQQGRDREAEQ